MAVTFTVEVDWHADGTWTEETARVRRVRARAGFAGLRSPVAAPGTCALTLDNRDRRFSPGNSASPLAGKLLPGRAVRVRASEDGNTWTLFRGTIARIAPEAGAWPGAVTITCADGIARLARARVSVPHADAVPVDEAVSDLVSAVYTPPALSAADNGDSLAHYGRTWEPEHTTVLDALADICRAVYGRFWVARDGTAILVAPPARPVGERGAGHRDGGERGPLDAGRGPGRRGVSHAQVISTRSRRWAARSAVDGAYRAARRRGRRAPSMRRSTTERARGALDVVARRGDGLRGQRPGRRLRLRLHQQHTSR